MSRSHAKRSFAVIFFAMSLLAGCGRNREPLTELIRAGRLDEAVKLINRGVGLDMPDSSGNTPLHLSVAFPDLMRILLAKGANPALTNRDGNTPLHQAAVFGNYESAAVLMIARAPLNPGNRDGETPLHLACYYGFADIAALMITNGADIACKDNDGDTALHEAALRDQLETAKILVENGASVNVVNRDGATPLDYAKDPHVQAYLKAEGAMTGFELFMKW